MLAKPIGNRVSAALPWIAFGSFLFMILAGLFVPVYTDETGWRLQERAGIDGVDGMMNDLCGPNTLAKVPWNIMPVRAFSAAVNQALADPLFLRLEGMACALAWAGLAWLLVARIQPDKQERGYVRTVMFSLLAMGVQPFIMVLSRPEQPVILMLLLAILTALWPAPRLAPARLAIFKCAAIVVMGAIASSYHMKGVAYSPAFAACLLFCAKGRGTLTPRIVGLAVLGAITVSSLLYWVHRFQCPGDAVLAYKLGHENVAVLLTRGDNIRSVLRVMILGTNPINYLQLMLAQNRGNNWLPVDMFQIVNDDRFSILIILAWYLALAWSAVKLGLFFWRKRLKAFAEPQAPIALALAACLCVWGASQINRNFYETAHYLPMAAVFCALCLTLPRPEPRETEPLLVTTAWLSLLVMLPSAIMVVSMSLGPLIEANRYRGYIPRQEISVPVFGYDKIRQDVSAAMKQAGMDPARRYHRLLIDDVTYLALQNNTFPLHRLGVLSVWNGEIKDPVRYLISRNSDGVVMGCKFLPKRMRDVAASSNGVCAISRKTLDQIDTGTGDGTG